MSDQGSLDDFLDEVGGRKAEAKRARDRGDWQRGVDILHRTIAAASDRFGDRVTGRVLAELADLWGIAGGIERRCGLAAEGARREEHLRASVMAYDQGFAFERQLEPAEWTTYNQINRICGRFLLEPAALRAPAGAGEPAPYGPDLAAAEETLVVQIATVRQRDPWAYCDLLTVRLLRRSPDAASTLQAMLRLRPRSFVYESAIAALQPLAEAAGDTRPELADAVDQLRDAADR